MAVKLEVVVDTSVSGEKLLGVPGCLEPSHVALPSSGGLVRHLTKVVQVSALPMLDARKDLAFGRAIGPEFIGHDHPGHVAQALQQLAKEALGRLRATAALHQHIEHISMLINRSPEVVQFASDANKQLIEKPFVSERKFTAFVRDTAPLSIAGLTNH